MRMPRGITLLVHTSGGIPLGCHVPDGVGGWQPKWCVFYEVHSWVVCSLGEEGAKMDYTTMYTTLHYTRFMFLCNVH